MGAVIHCNMSKHKWKYRMRGKKDYFHDSKQLESQYLV